MMFKFLLEYRRYIFVTAWHDLSSRFVGTTLGWLWLVIPPAVLVIIYGFVFSMVMPLKSAAGAEASSGTFVFYLASGLLPWLVFSEAMSRGTNIFVLAASYLKKLPIREEIFVARVAMSGFFMLIAIFVILCLTGTVLGRAPTFAWLALIPVAAAFAILLFGMTCVPATLNVFFRDVREGLGMLLQMWMWLLPIVYVETLIPDRMRWIFWIDPAYPFIRAIRDILVDGTFPSMTIWGLMALWDVLFLYVGVGCVTLLRDDLREAL
jgi:ABC-type polysaccharide/polyol phosphate export permease